MNNKTYQQLEIEPYIEHGVAKLRYKQPITRDMFAEEAQELAEAMIKANENPKKCLWELFTYKKERKLTPYGRFDP